MNNCAATVNRSFECGSSLVLLRKCRVGFTHFLPVPFVGGEWNCDPSLTRAIPEPSSDESVLGRNRNEICAVNLVNSYCLPSLWYRCEIWNPSSSDYRRLNVIWNNVLLAWECLVPPVTTAKYCHYLTQLIKEKFSSGRKLVVVKIAFFVQFLFWIHVLSKSYQNIHFIVCVSIQVKISLLCGNIFSTCQYFKPKFLKGFYHYFTFLNLCIL